MCGRPANEAGVEPGPALADSGAGIGSGGGAGKGNPSSRAGWIAAGIAVMALVVVLLFLGRERSPSPAAGPPVASAAGPANVDLSSMTPREAADRLFNRVMENVSTGDSAQARAFAPMALAAYDRVTDIDLDGLYHVAVLQLVNGEPEASLETTERIREEAPDHLFALYTAAQAHELLGDGAEAARMYEHFLASYNAEVQLERPEYSDHAPLLPMMRQEAESRAG